MVASQYQQKAVSAESRISRKPYQQKAVSAESRISRKPYQQKAVSAESELPPSSKRPGSSSQRRGASQVLIGSRVSVFALCQPGLRASPRFGS
jgi:hypothetical protein